MRGGYDTDIHLDGPGDSNLVDFFFLKEPQDFDLSLRLELSDFIEKHRSAHGHLDFALTISDRAGERGAGVAKQLGFQERIRNGRAVDDHERLALAGTVVVDGLGQKLFSGSTSSANEYLRVNPGRLSRHLKDSMNLLGSSDHVVELKPLRGCLPKLRILPLECLDVQRFPNDKLQLIAIDGLGDIVGSALSYGLNGILHGRVSGHDDHWELGSVGRYLFEQLQPVHVGHAYIGDNE